MLRHPARVRDISSTLVRVRVIVQLRQRAYQSAVPGLILVANFGAPGLNEVLLEPVMDIFTSQGPGVALVDVAEKSEAEEWHCRRQHVPTALGGLDVVKHLLLVVVTQSHPDADVPLGCRCLDAGRSYLIGGHT